MAEWCRRSIYINARSLSYRPGGHSTVFPWLPPPGVPPKVLKNIRVELLNALWELIHWQEGMHPLSAQTFPALSERSLEDHVEFSTYDLNRLMDYLRP